MNQNDTKSFLNFYQVFRSGFEINVHILMPLLVFAIIYQWKRGGCSTLITIFFFMSVFVCVLGSLRHCAIGWYVICVCDCGIS